MRGVNARTASSSGYVPAMRNPPTAQSMCQRMANNVFAQARTPHAYAYPYG